MKKIVLAFAVLVAFGLTGCGQKDVSFETLENAKTTANDNSLFNAQNFRQTNNVLFPGWSIIPNGDSSQTPACPQGDGWATLKLVAPEAKRVVKIKCSTVSGSTGCLADAEFKEKSYASEDGHCQPTTKVPFPLPKIAK